MPKVNNALYRGFPVRYIALSKHRLWFFESDILSALGLDTEVVKQVPANWRGKIDVKLGGKKNRIDVLSLFGIFSLCGRTHPKRAADFVYFLYRNRLGGAK